MLHEGKRFISNCLYDNVIFIFWTLCGFKKWLYDYQARNQMILTEEQIKQFEDDVKNDRPIDIKNYIVKEEDLYDNQLSRMSLKVSNTIGHTVQNILDFIFSKLEGMMKTKK